MESKLPRDVFQRTESVLFKHSASKQRLADLIGSIIHSAPANDNTPVAAAAGNPTERKALQLMDSPERKYLERVTKAVEDVLAELDDKHLAVFDSKYVRKRVEKVGVKQAAEEINICERSFYEYRNEIVERAAYRLGYWFTETM